jgi:putative hemolysin
MKRFLLMVIAVGMLCITACGTEPTPMTTEGPPAAVPTEEPPAATPDQGSSESPLATPPSDSFESPVGLPNPASVFCEEEGYKLELRTDASGTAGYCIFPDGSECEEWAFFRGECAPGAPPP